MPLTPHTSSRYGGEFHFGDDTKILMAKYNPDREEFPEIQSPEKTENRDKRDYVPLNGDATTRKPKLLPSRLG